MSHSITCVTSSHKPMLPNIQFCSDSDQILLRIWLDLDLAVNLLRSAQNTRLTAKPSLNENIGPRDVVDVSWALVCFSFFFILFSYWSSYFLLVTILVPMMTNETTNDRRNGLQTTTNVVWAQACFFYISFLYV